MHLLIDLLKGVDCGDNIGNYLLAQLEFYNLVTHLIPMSTEWVSPFTEEETEAVRYLPGVEVKHRGGHRAVCASRGRRTGPEEAQCDPMSALI